MAKFIDKVAAIIIRDGKLLLTWEEPKGLYLFPGGKREIKRDALGNKIIESDLECLTRELKEELSVKVKRADFYNSYCSNYEGLPVFLSCHFVEPDGEPKPCSEITSLHYVGLKEFQNYKNKMPDITKLIFEKLYKEGKIN